MQVIQESMETGKKVFDILHQAVRASASPTPIVQKKLLLEKALQYEMSRQWNPPTEIDKLLEKIW